MEQKSENKKHRNFAITDFELDINFWNDMLDKIKFIVIGEEICPETQRKHWQIAVSFNSPRSLNSIIKIAKPRHVEVCYKSLQVNEKYCEKDGNLILKHGDYSKQGHRTDLELACDVIMNGGSMSDIEPVMLVKYDKGLTKLRELHQPDRNFKPNVLWIWGSAGVGKTKFAVEYDDNHYIKDGTQWWDNYDHENTIIIDDFDARWPYRDFLRLLDRYKYQGQIKGGFVKINSKNIIITCEFPPQQFWSGNELKQVTRRIDKIIHLAELNEVTSITEQ